MKLRIAQVSATFPPYYGGTGNVCYRNSRELAGRGHHVHVFTAAVNGAPATELADGVHVTRLHSVMRYGNARLLPGLLNRLRGFDVIHLHYPFIGGELAALASLVTSTPLIVTYHQDVLLRGPLRFVESAIRHTFGRFSLRQASKVLFTTLDYGRESYIYPLLSGDERRIGELPNGVDVGRFSPAPTKAEVRRALGLPLDGSIALLVAALDTAHYFKGVDVLIDALSRSPRDVTAVIIGDGDMRSTYADSAKRRGLDGRVRFVGRVPDVELPLYYQSADVTLLPSTTKGEAFGLVLLESMACGTPVIASDLPGVRSVVTDGDDGILVEPGSPDSLERAIRAMFADPVKREQMGHRGRLKVESHYDWRLIGNQLESLYYGAIPSNRRLLTSPASGED